MNHKLRMTIAYDEPDEEGWIVARVVEVPGAISRAERVRRHARTSSMPCGSCSLPTTAM